MTNVFNILGKMSTDLNVLFGEDLGTIAILTMNQRACRVKVVECVINYDKY